MLLMRADVGGGAVRQKPSICHSSPQTSCIICHIFGVILLFEISALKLCLKLYVLQKNTEASTFLKMFLLLSCTLLPKGSGIYECSV